MKISLIFGIMFALMAASSFASSIHLDSGKSNKAEGNKIPGENKLQAPTTGKYKDESIGSKLISTFSQHISQDITPLQMTPGELKQFAGHSFQFIKAKCPALPAGKLYALNKYVAKLISKAEPKQGISAVVEGMVKSLSQCSKTKVTGTKTTTSDDGKESFWERYLDSLESIEADKSTEATGATPKTFVVEETGSPNSNDEASSWNTFKWFEKVFQLLENVIQKLFGEVGGPGSEPTRKRRSVTYVETPAPQQGTDERIQAMIARLQSNLVKGKVAFVLFFENLCRIYCQTCSSHLFDVRTSDFQAAAKALINFIEEDKSGSDLAAEHYLDDAFLQALDDC